MISHTPISMSSSSASAAIPVVGLPENDLIGVDGLVLELDGQCLQHGRGVER
ncbi:MAG: hypothetical protein ACJLS2_11380 [Microcella pacifica]